MTQTVRADFMRFVSVGGNPIEVTAQACSDSSMARRRSTEEIQQLLQGRRASGMTQTADCRQTGVALSTLGRYIWRRGSSRQR